MAFRDIAEIIKNNGGGSHAFEKAAQAANAAAAAEPQKAAGYFLLGWEAMEFVNVFERMPVSQDAARAAQERLADHAAALDAAGDAPEAVLAALNAMVATYLAPR
ncbi:hypothetical protein [Roseivivax sp.]